MSGVAHFDRINAVDGGVRPFVRVKERYMRRRVNVRCWLSVWMKNRLRLGMRCT